MFKKSSYLAIAVIVVAQPVAPAFAQPAETVKTTEAVEAADTEEYLDRLSDAAVNQETGILLAQNQAARGEYLEAIGSLERVLALHPRSNSARILHATYLCKIDDQRGGAVELGKLKKKNFPDQLWVDVLKICPQAGEE